MPKVTTQLIGSSPAFRKALADASVAARQSAPLLIYGQTGSGKGVIAEYVHRKSARSGRLVSLNCSTFQSNLFESELFGHMRGSFTGAIKDTAGLFESAEGGTLFLDEIGDTPLEIQPKLLRALEEGVIRRVGDTREIPVDVRLVCATNQDLKQLIAAGKFREDLYYRINSFVVTLPPLRERVEDIAELAVYFLQENGTPDGDEPKALALETVEALKAYSWPGNIRELRSAMSYAAAQADGRSTILLQNLPDTVLGAVAEVSAHSDTEAHLETFRELYRTGAESPQLWADFLLKFNDHLGSNKFARHDVIVCLRNVRGTEPTNNALVNEWQRHIKPVPLRLGLIHEDGKKLRIDLSACERVTQRDDIEPPPAENEAATRPPLADRNLHTNLDASRTTFVGRQKEALTLREMVLRGQPNLITVTGPGGTGKTRLSREVGRSLLGELPGGVWFADLTESRNIEGVSYAVAQALGVPLTSNQSPELVVGTLLRRRTRSLLILDNFEQVAEVASECVGDWVRGAPHVTFVVTSRALLGVEGEHEFQLEALPLPQEDASLEVIARSEAVRLFTERARVHHVGFALDEKSASAVARICHRLEGMPLAIELAAARTVIMKPEQIAERLDNVFDVLKSSRRDLQPRQRSLHATLDWSYDLLKDVERWVFAQLSVFRGGFFLEAAEEILDLSRFPDAPLAMDVIQSLREKSLLRAVETAYETRFNMYQVIREYAGEFWQKLANDTERASVAERFAAYYRRYGVTWTRRVYSPDALEAMDRLDLARANLRAAMEWAFERHNEPGYLEMVLELSNELQHLYRVRGPGNERVSVLRRALAIADGNDSTALARLLSNLSQAETETGDAKSSRGLALDAVAMSERVGDEMQIAKSRFQLAGVEFAEGNTERAQQIHEEVLPVFLRLGNDANAGRVLTRMALMHASMGDFEAAVARSKESERILSKAGDLTGIGFVLSIRASVYMKSGENEFALEAVVASERIYRELSDKRMTALSLGNRSLICRRLRRLDEALTLANACNLLVRDIGDRRMLSMFLMNLGLLYIELDDLDNAERVFKECRREADSLPAASIQSVSVENLGVIETGRRNFAAARKLFDEADALAADDDAQQASVGISRAELLIAEGKSDEAVKAAERGYEYLRSQPAHEGRDWFRTLLIRAHATDAGTATTAASEASKVAKKLRYTATDPSRFIRNALEFLKKIQSR